MSLALARKYRPKNFASVAVQSHVSNTLKGAIARGRVAHGYLLCGPRGTGKTTLARVLAMALNCENRDPSGEPCGACTSCTRIWSGSASLDVVEIDGASNRGVDDARELRERAMYAPSGEERYKVYIVDEAHMLTREAWNALLKVLEEPPPRVVFVFATTEPQKIAQAAAPVLSRLQRFDLKRIGPAEIRDRLAAVLDAEGVRYDIEALGMIARAADGGLRDALSLTDQVLSLGTESEVTPERVREALGLVAEDEYVALLDLVAERRAGEVFDAVGRLADLGVDFGGLLTGLADILRAQLAIALGGSPGELSERARAALVERKDRLSTGDLMRMLHAVGELEPRFRKSGQQQLLLEMLLVRFALLDRTVALEDMLKGIGGGEDSGARNAAAARVTSSPPPGQRATAVELRPTAPSVMSTAASSTVRAPARAPAPAPALSPASVPVSPASVPVAGRPTPASRPIEGARLPDLNVLAERWDEVVAHLRSAGRVVLATVLEGVTPVAVSGSGALTVQLDDDSTEPALEAGQGEIVAALRAVFGGGERLVLRRSGQGAPPAARRLTAESVKAERLATLRKRDGVLGAAIDALDLDLIE